MPAPDTAPSLEEIAQLHRISQAMDDVMEESLKARESLRETLRRALPRALELTGARAVVVTTRDEERVEQSYSEGDFGDVWPGTVLVDAPEGVHPLNGDTLVSQALDVVGVEVGRIGMIFSGDHGAPERAARAARMLYTVSEQLDDALASIQIAAEKHQLILEFNAHLSNRVFETGMDEAVLAIARRVRLPGFMLVFRDAVRPQLLHYRTYRDGHLEAESAEQPLPALDDLIRRRGSELIRPDNAELRSLFDRQGSTEAVLIAGATVQEPLGKILVWSGGDGFSAFTLDVLRVLASALSQRLIDYNRERIHLSQFFAAEVIDELLKDPNYQSQYLTPREEEIGILYADINAFTRICEKVLESPSRIGRFVDRWSNGVVGILWRHGGVFDKMVGDCVIGLFGPPFFQQDRVRRAEAMVRAAQEIQAFTEAMSADPEVTRIRDNVELPGLGVAIGVNLARGFCGLFGPNQQYTGFSTGMNQTARLQSLGGFRETLVMASVREALQQSADPYFRGLRYGPLAETAVKNVAQPLRYFRLLPGAAS